ncbi:P-loop containing nucleoside triphosphate hydrolase protein [Colletotrichum cereale]|nr:P-loop containing nucleoside triphosphate hydrolase protein [Colletotrichum cereale]
MQGRRELPEPSPTENGAENGDDEIDGRSSTDRNFVRANGEWVHIDDFLGEKWERRAYRIHNIPLPDLPPIRGLKTDLREWHIHEFNGCILGDEMGMGKTLVCIVTALLYRQEHPSSNFTLVVTPKSCIRGWKKQLEVHFYEGEGPKTFVLEDTKTTAKDLVKMNPDFVLVTWGFLKSRFTVYEIGRLFTKLRHERGLRWLLAKYSRYLPADGLPPRENNVLHSELYEYLGKSSGICFLDEAQIAKNQNTLAHEAVQSLPFSIKIPVTGSMVHNTWVDAGGIINQLSLGIFNNVKHFQNAFSVAGAKRHGERSYKMEPSRKHHLLRLLLALTVSRPASLLRLPSREEHVDNFTVPDSASIEIALLVKKFFGACHMGRTDCEAKAIVHMVTAQKWASNQLLLKPLKPPKPHKEDSESGIENDETQDSEASYDGETPQASDNDDEDVEYDDDDGSEHLSGKEHQASDIQQSDSQSDSHELSEASASRVDVLMHEDGETDVLTEKEHVVWNRILDNASDEEILSPRVFTVVQRLKKIIENYPGEKIVVFSTYARFLDIVGVAIQRDSDIHFQALRFDGSLDREERDRRATAFDEDRDLPVMMVSKGAGGVGMDFSVASHIIQCENWWNGNDELQAHFRCWRGGQTKTVHIWRVIATNSSVDNYIRNRNEQKMVVVDEIMSVLRRADEDEVVLPSLDLEEEESDSS